MDTIIDELFSEEIGKKHGSGCRCGGNCSGQESETAGFHPNLGHGFKVSGNREIGGFHPNLGPGFKVSGEAAFSDLEMEWEDSELVGTDDRKRIKNTLRPPFRWICSLRLLYPDPDKRGDLLAFYGTGTLVSSRHILTCGHNLYVRYQGSKGTWTRGSVARVEVAPGKNGNRNPFGSVVSSSFRVHPRWRAYRSNRYKYDLGMIKLPTRIGNKRFRVLRNRKLGFWGSRTLGAKTRLVPLRKRLLKRKVANVSGYPGDKGVGNNRQQWWAGDRIVNVNPRAGSQLIYYKTDTCAGHSGSPIWLYNSKNRRRYLVAVHTGPCISSTGSRECRRESGTPCITGRQRYSSNRGVYLSRGVIRLIKRWMRTMR